MRARATLKPGQPGTKELTKQYGERLLYVRYRYDRKRQLRYKTIEIIVDEAPWQPARAARDSASAPNDETSIPTIVEQAGTGNDQPQHQTEPDHNEQLQSKSPNVPPNIADSSAAATPNDADTEQSNAAMQHRAESNHQAPTAHNMAPRPHELVFIKVQWGEIEIAKRVKDAGGRWHSDIEAWSLPYHQAKRLGLLNRRYQPP